MMKKMFLLLLLGFSFLIGGQSVFAVEYEIDQYIGDLVIHEDNTADYIEVVTYAFDSDYNGQYVTLGEAGNVPSGFAISSEPEVTAYRNGDQVEVTHEVEKLSDGIQLKVYNAGKNSDTVTIVVNWKLSHILWHYQDIAELNWTPISDWDETINQVNFSVTTDKKVDDTQLFVHTGYFGADVEQTVEDGVYSVSVGRIDSGKNVELHAYWDQSILNSNDQIQEKRLDSFLAQENDIVRKQNLLTLALYQVGPVLLIVIVLFALFRFHQFKELVDPKAKQIKGRVYMYPEDYTPLVLTEYIYNLSIEELNPTKGGVPKNSVTFDHLVQATLMDLIDRRVIEVSGEGDDSRLEWQANKEVTAYEKDFLKMVFGQEKNVATNAIFADYAFDDKTIKNYRKEYRGSKLEKQVRSVGQKAVNKMEKQFGQISKLVEQFINQAGWPHNYREFTAEESSQKRWVTILFSIGFVLNLGLVFLAFHVDAGSAILLYLASIVLIFILFSHVGKSFNRYSYYGVLTDEGRMKVQAWQGFRQMLKDIKRFNQSEFGDLVLWNRILVYATLFGEAKKVEKYLKVHQISLPVESGLSARGFRTGYLAHSVNHQLTHSLVSATNASNFSVASGSAGSSSSSGGFSGGGGGGGGGAF